MVDISGSRQLSGKAEGRRVRISVFGSTAGTGRRTEGRRTVSGKKFNRIRKKAKEKPAAPKNPALKPVRDLKKPIGINIFENPLLDDDEGGGGDGGGGGGGGDGDGGGGSGGEG